MPFARAIAGFSATTFVQRSSSAALHSDSGRLGNTILATTVFRLLAASGEYFFTVSVDVFFFAIKLLFELVGLGLAAPVKFGGRKLVVYVGFHLDQLHRLLLPFDLLCPLKREANQRGLQYRVNAVVN